MREHLKECGVEKKSKEGGRKRKRKRERERDFTRTHTNQNVYLIVCKSNGCLVYYVAMIVHSAAIQEIHSIP